MLGEWKVSEQVREAETRKRDVEIFWSLFFFSCWRLVQLLGIFFTDFSEWIFARGELTVLMVLDCLGI